MFCWHRLNIHSYVIICSDLYMHLHVCFAMVIVMASENAYSSCAHGLICSLKGPSMYVSALLCSWHSGSASYFSFTTSLFLYYRFLFHSIFCASLHFRRQLLFLVSLNKFESQCETSDKSLVLGYKKLNDVNSSFVLSYKKWVYKTSHYFQTCASKVQYWCYIVIV